MSSLDLTREWLQNVLRPYPSRDRLLSEVMQILAERRTLAVKTDAFTFDSGQTALLLLLHGTLPINYKGATYHIPLHVWVPHEYPRSPPLAFVVPTKEMGVRKGREVEPSGRVRAEVVEQWWRSWENKSVEILLRQLTAVFSAAPPVYAKPPESASPAQTSRSPIASTSSPQPVQMQSQTQAGQPPPPPARPSFVPPNLQPELLPQYRPAPTPPPHSFPQSHSRQSSGAFAPPQPPATPPQHPGSPPVPSRPVQRLPQSPSSPVPHIPQRPYVAIPQGGYNPQQQQPMTPPTLQYQPPQANHTNGWQSNGQPAPGPSYGPGSGPPPNGQYQQGPPPVPAPETHPPSHQLPQQPPQQPLQQAPVVRRPVQDLLSSPETIPNSLPSDATTFDPTAPPPLPPSKPPPPSLLHLHSILLPHLNASLPPLLHSLESSRTHLAERREDLLTGEPAIRDEMARLEAVKKVCDSVGRKMGEVVSQGEERVTDLESRGEVSVDELVCGISIVHNQLIDLVAEDNAIEDTIYHMTRALDAERVDLDRYLKSIRSLAREQYMKRALIERILQGMGQTQGW
ncbi:hypothetical protein CI109_102255 [Kwoniella shandongensis]|uniref:Uncharacterized protein n=1 Tax=Kwoniella shandongensis TaxID=1734106 RepID=A0A5M6BYK4_9TREE|nr:uncharacterized protein CI109_003591 [Kwoniella shandongensis]KAA5527938.1 hypothetical protein CI109_003591 [Kwoniella shandongensis]